MSLVCFHEKNKLEEDLGYSMDSMDVRSVGADVELSLKEMVWSSTRDEKVVGDVVLVFWNNGKKNDWRTFMYFVWVYSMSKKGG